MAFKTRKAVMIGAGHVGSHCALALAARGICDDIALIDINQPKARAQATDIANASVFLPHHVEVYAGDYSDCTDAEIVVICAGSVPVLGQNRADTLAETLEVMKDVAPRLKASGFNGVLINISNPCDAIAYYLYEHLDLPAKQVIGTSTVLDSARLRRVLSEELLVDQKSIHAYVLGEHGESQMVPWSGVSIGGKSLFELMKQNPATYGKLDLADVAARARRAGWTVLEGKGSTEFGIAAGLAEIVSMIFHDERRVVPVAALLEGQYGQRDVYAGVPVVLGKNGVEQILELDMTDGEKTEFAASCAAMRELYSFTK